MNSLVFYEFDEEKAHQLVRECAALYSKQFYQGPRWDHEPTIEERALEQQDQFEAENARHDLIRKACDLVEVLTGLPYYMM